ncbi:exosortase-associated protein EpsI, V-type [Sphingomonas sp. ID0503]|uniref:exosortase-associated protein EpsI, V-type n=1 Tax=Sphingomonas sp. ID0503 TaxID=3399691 RepID=UPI003AFAF6F3
MSESAKMNRRQLLFGGTMLAAAGLAWWRMPHAETRLIDPSDVDTVIPTQIGPWVFETKSGLVLPPPDQLADQLYDQVMTRTYQSVTELPIMLLIAYGGSQDGMLTLHRPETCYPASGYSLSDVQKLSVPVPTGGTIPGRFFTGAARERTEQVLYWTRIGEHFPGDWAEQRWVLAADNLKGLIPDGVLVRMSTITNDAAQAQATLTKFIQMLVASSPKLGRRLLLGDARAGA